MSGDVITERPVAGSRAARPVGGPVAVTPSAITSTTPPWARAGPLRIRVSARNENKLLMWGGDKTARRRPLPPLLARRHAVERRGYAEGGWQLHPSRGINHRTRISRTRREAAPPPANATYLSLPNALGVLLRSERKSGGEIDYFRWLYCCVPDAGRTADMQPGKFLNMTLTHLT